MPHGYLCWAVNVTVYILWIEFSLVFFGHCDVLGLFVDFLCIPRVSRKFLDSGTDGFGSS